MEKKRSWICTVILQVSLCVAFYIAINLGQPQQSIYVRKDGIANSGKPLDVYFISVLGGYRDVEEQIHLLQLMENVAKVYEAEFIVNISELGEDDPLTKNASRVFSSANIHWYTTRSSKGQEATCFLELTNMTNRKMLTIAGVNSKSLLESMLKGSATGLGNSKLNWPIQPPETTSINWFIVFGYDPVAFCEDNEEQLEAKQYETLRGIFTKYSVNAYISRESCMNQTFEDGVNYIGLRDQANGGLNLTSSNGGLTFQKKSGIGFLLHRVSSLKFVTYFVTLGGEVVNKVVIQQRGKEAM